MKSVDRPSAATKQNFRITFLDGRVETVIARAFVRSGPDYVFFSEAWSALLRVPAKTVLDVKTLRVRPSWLKQLTRRSS
jgi:hypothetical protein